MLESLEPRMVLCGDTVSIGSIASVNEGDQVAIDVTVSGSQCSMEAQITVLDANGGWVSGSSVFPSGGTATYNFQVVDDDPTGTSSDVYSVQAVLFDMMGEAISTANSTFTVSNVAPTLESLSASTNNWEATLHGWLEDVAMGDFLSVTVDWGDGSPVTTTSATPGMDFGISHTYSANGAYTIQVTGEDDDLGSVSGSTSVTFDLPAPTISVNSAPQGNEGGNATATGTYTVPAGNWGTLTSSWGSISDNLDGTWSWSGSVADGPDTIALDVTVTDNLGLSDTESVSVTVLNVAPSVTVNNATVTVAEGQSASNSGGYWDPGLDDVASISASIGAVVDNQNGTWSWSYDSTDGPDESQDVTITVTDSDGASGSETFAFVVNNVAPAVTANAATVTVDEGVTAVNSGTYGDPGVDVVTLNASLGNLVDNGNGSWSWTFDTTDGPDESQTVTVTATDSDGASSTATFSLVVNNIAPTVATGASTVTVNEGDAAFNSGVYSDPGADLVNLSASFGTLVDNGNGTWDWSHDTSDGPDESQTVTITATDSDGASSTATFALVVDNVAPLVTANNASVTVGEGQTASNNGTYSDPGIDDVSSVSASRGTATDLGGGAWSWTFDSSDGPDESGPVTITITDSDGAGGTVTFDLVVDNLPPVVTVDAAAVTVDEGSTAVNAGTYADPGVDTVASITASIGTVVDDGNGGWDWSFDTFDGPDDSATVTITVTDSDGAEGIVTFQLVVKNVKPYLLIDSDTTFEGAVWGFPAGQIFDPGQDDVVIEWYDWGSGQTQNGSHLYVDDHPSATPQDVYSMSVGLFDGDEHVVDGIDVTVQNVAPTVTVSAPFSADAGEQFTVTVWFTDPGIHYVDHDDDPQTPNVLGTETHAGISESLYTEPSQSVSYSYQTSLPGGYLLKNHTITAGITDDDGGVGTDDAVVSVSDSVNLRTDSNNDGLIDATDESVEDSSARILVAHEDLRARVEVVMVPFRGDYPVASSLTAELIATLPNGTPISGEIKVYDPNGAEVALTRVWQESEWDDIPSFFDVEGLVSNTLVNFALQIKDGAAVVSSDVVKLDIKPPVDLDIDSDNDDFLGDPDRTLDEDNEEGDAPGKYIQISTRDWDEDDVPDYADGYDLDNTAANADDHNSSEDMVNLKLEIPDWVDGASTVTFAYEMSDPNGVGNGPDFALPAGGGQFRLWLQEQDAVAPKDRIASGSPAGHLIETGVVYSLADLNISPGETLSLYGEAVQVATGTLSVSLTPAGLDWLQHPDDVVAAGVDLDLDVDSNNRNGLERTLEEDRLEDNANEPGAYLTVNDADVNQNNVQDWVDWQIAGHSFLTVSLTLAGFEDDDLVELEYDSSDPSVLINGDPEPGALRLWTKDANVQRDPAMIDGGPNLGGDFVTPGILHSVEDLGGPGTVTLYLEGLQAGKHEIRVNVYSDDGQTIAFTDSVFVTVASIDLDVDSDNNNLLTIPERTLDEELIEDIIGSYTLPGKYLVVNRRDADADGILDFADGFDRDEAPGSADDESAPANLVPLVVEVPEPIDPDAVSIKFTYSASDPLFTTDLAPAAGSLRIWAHGSGRTQFDALFGGSYVAPGTNYQISDLVDIPEGQGAPRVFTLYVEAVNINTASAVVGQETITIEMDPDGYDPNPPQGGTGEPSDADYTFQDKVVVTVINEVSISATNYVAQEWGDNGRFTVTRGEHNTDGNLFVYYMVDTVSKLISPSVPSASANLSDYTPALQNYSAPRMIGRVLIPDGASMVTIDVAPANDAFKEWDEAIQVVLITHDQYALQQSSITESYYAYSPSHPVVAGGYGTAAAVLLLDDDDVETPQSRNVDAQSTGLSSAARGNGVVAVGLEEGSLDLTLPVTPISIAPSYRGDDNLAPIVVVDMQIPGSSMPDYISAVATIGGVSGQPVTFDLLAIGAGNSDTLRFHVPGYFDLSTFLPSGHYDADVLFTAHYPFATTIQKTVRTTTEIVNRVDDALGDTSLGKRWSIDGVDRLVLGDEINTPLASSLGEATRLADAGAVIQSGAAILRGDNTSAWHVSNGASIVATQDNTDLSAADLLGWAPIFTPSSPNEPAYHISTAGIRGESEDLTYHFDSLDPSAVYQVYVTWTPALSRTTQAAYSVEGATTHGAEAPANRTFVVNQRMTPGEVALGSYRSLGFYVAQGGQLDVVLRTDQADDGEVVADEVILVSNWQFTTPAGSFNELLYDSISNADYWVDPSFTPDDGSFTRLDKFGTRTEFSNHGLQDASVDRNNNRTDFSYNAQQQLTAIKNQGDITTTLAYSGGYLNTITTFDGRVTTFATNAGLVTDVIQPPPIAGGAAPNFHFEYAGPEERLSKVIDPRGFESTIQYDEDSRRVSDVTNPDSDVWLVFPQLTDGLTFQAGGVDGTVRKPTADGIGNQAPSSGANFVEASAHYFDPRGNGWVYQLDGFGLVTALANPAPFEDVWLTRRNQHGQVAESKQPAGGGGSIPLGELTTSFGYDSRGNVTNTVFADSTSQSAIFDGDFSQIVSTTDAMGRVTTYALDGRGNATLKTEINASGPNRQTHWTYTAAPSGVGDLPGGLVDQQTVAYQSNDAVTTDTDYFTSGIHVGLVEHVTYALGTADASVVTFGYDSARRRNQFVDEHGSITQL